MVDRLLDIERVLLDRGANTIPHSKYSLQRHLVGTYELLEHWQQRESLCLAGLLHSAYSTDAFRRGVFNIDERALVTSLIGQEAETLAFLFCSTRRDELFSSIRNGNMVVNSGMSVSNWRGGDPVWITQGQAADLIILHIANVAEQRCAADGSPMSWLSVASDYASCAAAFSTDVPAIFSGCSALVAAEDEDNLLSAYSLATSTTTERGSYIVPALLRAAESVSCVGEPFIWLGLLLLSEGELDTATAFGQRALTLLDEWGVAWDKRLSHGWWRRLAAYLSNLENLSDSESAFLMAQTRAILHANTSPAGVFARLDEMGALESDEEALRSAHSAAFSRTNQAEEAVPPRFAEYVASLSENSRTPRMMIYPRLSSKPWYDSKAFCLTRDLERMASQIAREFHSLDPSFFHPESEAIARQGSWDVMMLVERGRRNRDLCTACPTTMGIVESHRTVLGLAGLVYFSRLAPRTRVTAHKGPTNMRLRCHLGIEIPVGCGITVDGVHGRWAAGECIVFDDSLQHEVWNDSVHDRIVLIVDMWHPDLTDREIELLEGLHRYADAHAANLLKYWGKNARSRARTAETRQEVAGAF